LRIRSCDDGEFSDRLFLAELAHTWRHKRMTFQELMSPSITDAGTFAELMTAYEDGTLE
jgi:hypothetical protein